jgi:hypothetical protein
VTAANQWEQAARDKKILRLIDEIDRQFDEATANFYLGQTPTTARMNRAVLLLQCMHTWTQLAWKQLADQAGVKVPSEHTIVEIMGVYRRRSMPQISAPPVVRGQIGVTK